MADATPAVAPTLPVPFDAETDLEPISREEAGRLQELEGKIGRSFAKIGREQLPWFLEIYEQRLYRARHRSIAAYCAERWGITSRGTIYEALAKASAQRVIEAQATERGEDPVTALREHEAAKRQAANSSRAEKVAEAAKGRTPPTRAKSARQPATKPQVNGSAAAHLQAGDSPPPAPPPDPEDTDIVARCEWSQTCSVPAQDYTTEDQWAGRALMLLNNISARAWARTGRHLHLTDELLDAADRLHKAVE